LPFQEQVRFQLKQRRFLAGGPRSQKAIAASLARDKVAMSDSWPSGQIIRQLSGMTRTSGFLAFP